MIPTNGPHNPEQSLREFCRYIREDFPGTVSAGIAPQFVQCTSDGKRYTIFYPAGDWMRNPGGAVHGGVLAAMMDNAMGGLTYILCGGLPTPTISLNLSYVRPAIPGKPIYVDAEVVSSGRTMGYTTASAWQDSPDKPVCTAAGVYYTAVKP